MQQKLGLWDVYVSYVFMRAWRGREQHGVLFPCFYIAEKATVLQEKPGLL